jgi:hypothetical protein
MQSAWRKSYEMENLQKYARLLEGKTEIGLTWHMVGSINCNEFSDSTRTGIFLTS